ncbi:hypothetical protein, partial [Comamonas sp.]|uniref:hypothetical protein n=1 Tax=Comamonas sp. TaxID=34028 RepID=UPI00258D4854
GAVTGGQHWLWGGPGGAGFPVGQGMVDPTGGYSSYTGQWTNIIKSFTSTTSRSYATGGNALITWITIGTVLGERV